MTQITTKTQINYDTLLPAVKAGRCYNGAHRDRGQVVHAVPSLPKTSGGCWFDKAVCGAQPSGRSYGWDNTTLEINCPKCLKKINGR
jgi:hypothetical protein